MSLRQRVDRTRITVFLQQLGTRFRQSARLYLVGGTTLVFEALCPQTLDIDVVLDVSAEAHSALMQAIRELKKASACLASIFWAFFTHPTGHHGARRRTESSYFFRRNIKEIHRQMICTLEYSHSIGDHRVDAELLAKLEGDLVLRVAHGTPPPHMLSISGLSLIIVMLSGRA